MACKSGIPYIDLVHNPVVGCKACSPACENCWAARSAHRLAKNPNPKVSAAYSGLTREVDGRIEWTGEVRLVRERLQDLTHVRRQATIGVVFMGDLFHEGLPDEDVITTLETFAAHNLRHEQRLLVTTKRWMRMTRLVEEAWQRSYDKLLRDNYPYQPVGLHVPYQQVWFGGSCWDQASAEAAVVALRRLRRIGGDQYLPHWHTWLSYEPALGGVDWAPLLAGDDAPTWLVMGVESGPKRRLAKCEACKINPGVALNDGYIGACRKCSGTGYAAWQWAADTARACQAAGTTKLYLKQLPSADGKVIHAPYLDGRQWLETPWETP